MFTRETRSRVESFSRFSGMPQLRQGRGCEGHCHDQRAIAHLRTHADVAVRELNDFV